MILYITSLPLPLLPLLPPRPLLLPPLLLLLLLLPLPLPLLLLDRMRTNDRFCTLHCIVPMMIKYSGLRHWVPLFIIFVFILIELFLFASVFLLIELNILLLFSF